MAIGNAGQGAAGLRRLLLLKILWKSLAVAALDFLLLGVWGPNLVNRHQNLALAGAVVCLLLALWATGWLLLQLWRDIGLLNDPGRRVKLVHRRTTED